MMDVYETKEERKEKLRAKETAEANLKAVENKKKKNI